MEKLHVSAYNGHLQIWTTFLLKEFYIICLNRVVMLRSHHDFTCFCYAKFGGMSVGAMNLYVAGCGLPRGLSILYKTLLARKLSKSEDGR